jgi:arginase
MKTPSSITVYQGLAGDRNDLGIPGALLLGKAMAERSGLPFVTVGEPRPALNTNWAAELKAAAPDLRKLADHLSHQLATGSRPITVLNRCAAAIATIPRVVAQHPDVCVVWFDAHADLNTPASTISGYLGGLALSAPAGLWDSGFGNNLALASLVLVGSRDLDPFERELVDAGKVRLVAADSPTLSATLVEAVAHRPVYVHLDCDVLEPGLVPTEFRVSDGLSLPALNEAFSALAGTTLVGMEIAEFQYSREPRSTPASPHGLIDAIQPALAALQAG